MLHLAEKINELYFPFFWEPMGAENFFGVVKICSKRGQKLFFPKDDTILKQIASGWISD